MQCNSTRFTNGCILNFLGFIKNYPACRPAACKKFKQSQLGISTAKIPIYVASLFKSFSHVTLSAPSDLSFLPELYAIEYALRYINEASSLLQNFELRVIHSGTNVSIVSLLFLEPFEPNLVCCNLSLKQGFKLF